MTAPDPSMTLPAGTVALVTGAAGGIGQAIARLLAERGAAVAGIDVQNLDDTAALVEKAGARWVGVMADLTAASQLEDAVEECRRALGDITVLVNNAAIDDPISFDDLDLDRWRRVLSLDLEVPFRLVKAVVEGMRRAGHGRVINIASGSVVNPCRASSRTGRPSWA
jgi:NAD(P)-dependent dehydrogenase (short-subunit alcohol dehydrogenase family)